MKHLLLLIVFFPVITLSQAVNEQGIPIDTTYNPERELKKIKEDYPEAVIARDDLPEGVEAYRNVVYLTLENTPYGDRALHMEIFRPEKVGIYPAVIMVHGGGWRAGVREMQVPLAQRLAAKGFVTLCVEYQLSLEAKYPAAVHNIKAGIRWTKANAEKYGIDPDNIAISGGSAGGQLAALVGMTNGVKSMEGNQGYADYSSEVQAVIDIDGVLNFLAPLSLNIERDPNTADAFWFGGMFEDIPLTWKEASSIYWVDENSVPVLFLNSGYPRFHAGQDEMIGIMDRHGIYTEVHKFDVMVHPFWLFEPWIDTTAVYMAKFLEKVFKIEEDED